MVLWGSRQIWMKQRKKRNVGWLHDPRSGTTTQANSTAANSISCWRPILRPWLKQGVYRMVQRIGHEIGQSEVSCMTNSLLYAIRFLHSLYERTTVWSWYYRCTLWRGRLFFATAVRPFLDVPIAKSQVSIWFLLRLTIQVKSFSPGEIHRSATTIWHQPLPGDHFQTGLRNRYFAECVLCHGVEANTLVVGCRVRVWKPNRVRTVHSGFLRSNPDATILAYTRIERRVRKSRRTSRATMIF
jgi:hypothetical protein